MSDLKEHTSFTPQEDEPRLVSFLGWTITERRLLVIKLDTLLLSWAFVAGITKDMDQSATTQAYVSGMREALSLYGNELVEFTTYFSIAYAICIIPSQMIQTRIRSSLFLPLCEVAWGLLTLFTYAAKNARTIFALRFFLGVFEATSWPGLVALLFNWYTPSEIGKRIAIFGVSGQAGSMFLGILQAALYRNLNGVAGLEGWQWLFIVCGLITVFWGLLGLLIIPDSPSNTRALWLTRPQRALAVTRMTDYGITTAKIIPKGHLWKKIKATVRSPLSWLFTIAYVQFAWSQRANSYFLLYLKGLEKADGTPLYSTYKVNLLPLGGYSLSIVANIGLNAISDWKQWRLQISVLAASIQLVACAVLSAWPDSTPTIMAFYYITFSTAAWGYALVAWLGDILKREPEARSLLIGVVVTLTYVGHATIPLGAWRVSDSPQYPIGFPLSTAFAAGGILSLVAIWWYVQQNPDVVEHGFAGSDSDESDAEGSFQVSKLEAVTEKV